jgi:hypothetical protein
VSGTRPTRATVAGRTYLDLQNLARRQRRPTDELHQLYALEGFLARLAVSPYADQLVLKGGVLLAAYDTRRPTRDVDLQGQRMSNKSDDVLTAQDVLRGHPRFHIVKDQRHPVAEHLGGSPHVFSRPTQENTHLPNPLEFAGSADRRSRNSR